MCVDSQKNILFDCDILLSFPLLHWPTPAQEWITRERKWPDVITVQRLARQPCHIIAKPRSENDILSWRFSFSLQVFLRMFKTSMTLWLVSGARVGQDNANQCKIMLHKPKIIFQENSATQGSINIEVLSPPDLVSVVHGVNWSPRVVERHRGRSQSHDEEAIEIHCR